MLTTCSTNVLPSVVNHELSILSACFCIPDCINDIVDELRPEYFYPENHQRIFKAIVDIHKAGNAVDANEVLLSLNAQTKVAWGTKIAEILSHPIPSSIQHYCKIITDTYLLRQMIVKLSESLQACYNGVNDAEQTVDDVQRKILSIEVGGSIESSSFGQLASEAIERYEALYRNRGKLSGLPTGYYMLDNYTCGLQPSNLYVLAARPSMGKSALIGNIVKQAAAENTPMGGFSLEMSAGEWVDRAIASESKLNTNKFRSGYFGPGDWDRLVSVMGRIERLPIYIDDTGGLHYSEIRKRARKMVKKNGCRMIFIDHLQLVHGDKGGNRDREIGGITGAFKEMAKELRIPVVLLSQLNRGLEIRPNKRPTLADLRDSGNIEQDADCVMFLYRRAVYGDWDGFQFQGARYTGKPSTEPSGDLLNAFQGDAELNVAKQRNGPVGAMKLYWDAKTTTFFDVERRADHDQA